MDNNQLPKKFYKFKKLWSKLDAKLKSLKISRLSACVNYVLEQKNFDKVIIGFDDIKQLKQILEIKRNKKIINVLKKFSSKNKKLINPTKW